MEAVVLVINTDEGPLCRVSVKHAIRMLCRKVAEIHEFEPDRRMGAFPMPTVVKLVRYVYTKWRYSDGPGWSRNGVLTRDQRICAYCRGEATTVDHVIPSSRGGRNSWNNTVAACGGCNQRKGNRTPGEAKMPLRTTPRAPSWASIAPR